MQKSIIKVSRKDLEDTIQILNGLIGEFLKEENEVLPRGYLKPKADRLKTVRLLLIKYLKEPVVLYVR